MIPLPWAITAPLVALVVAAGVYDIRFRRIPNWLTVSGVLAGFLINAAVAPRLLSGLRFAASGFALAFGIHFLFYLLHFTGAGDVKLMAAVGALVGTTNWLVIFVLNAIVGGVLAMVMILARGRVRRTFFNIGFALSELKSWRAPYLKREELDVNSAQAMRLPRGALVALGTLLFLGIAATR